MYLGHHTHTSSIDLLLCRLLVRRRRVVVHLLRIIFCLIELRDRVITFYFAATILCD